MLELKLVPGGSGVDASSGVTQLAQLLRDWNEPGADKAALRPRIRAIGNAADLLGGFDAMTTLDRAVRRTGIPTEPLNYLWDGIGDWQA